MRTRIFKGEPAVCAKCNKVIRTSTKGHLHFKHGHICGPCYLVKKQNERKAQGLL